MEAYGDGDDSETGERCQEGEKLLADSTGTCGVREKNGKTRYTWELT